MPENPNIGAVITNPKARKIVYGVYAGAAAAVGGVSAYFLAAQLPLPTELIGAQGVVAYAGILVAGLSIANTPSAPSTPEIEPSDGRHEAQ